MKAHLLLLALLTSAALTGCSADDLAGPDAAEGDAVVLSQASSDEARRPALLAGTWRAADSFGSVTLFLDETAPQPPPTPGPVQAKPFEGKGVLSRLPDEPVAVLIEGSYRGTTIDFALTDTREMTVAKARGEISRDFSLIKVLLIDDAGDTRELVFERF